MSYIDLLVPGFIEFENEDGHLTGSFQFGAVVGWMDCRVRENAGEGRNDSDPAC